MGGPGSGQRSKNILDAPWIDELRDLWKSRDPHTQKLLEPFFPERPNFPGTQFIAYVVKTMRQTAEGNLEVTFTIPFEFKDLGYKLADALAVPLSVDVQLWKPFEDEMYGDEEGEKDNGGSGLANVASDSNGETVASSVPPQG